MSPVGHSLVGLAFAALALPKSSSRKRMVILPIVFVALANLPDWPFPNWGHDQYRISHSVFVNLLLIAIAMLVWSMIPWFRSQVPVRFLWMGAAAWLSHLLLDTFYNHGRGLAIYWPFSSGRLNLAIPCFDTLDLSQSIVSRHNLAVYGIEAVIYLPVLFIALVIANSINRFNIAGSSEPKM